MGLCLSLLTKLLATYCIVRSVEIWITSGLFYSLKMEAFILQPENGGRHLFYSLKIEAEIYFTA
jgi:hypothetical protein